MENFLTSHFRLLIRGEPKHVVVIGFLGLPGDTQGFNGFLGNFSL
jgi:hypothetical protein